MIPDFIRKGLPSIIMTGSLKHFDVFTPITFSMLALTGKGLHELLTVCFCNSRQSNPQH